MREKNGNFNLQRSKASICATKPSHMAILYGWASVKNKLQ